MRPACSLLLVSVQFWTCSLYFSLEAVPPSLVLLEEVLAELSAPVWINADILSGPGGQAQPLDAESFLSAVTSLPAHLTLSLGWTTGWTSAAHNPGEHNPRGHNPGDCVHLGAVGRGQ